MTQIQCGCHSGLQAETLPSLDTWKCVHASYQPGLIRIVTPRWAVFSKLNKWLRRPLPSPDDCDMRISVAVMQRMYISALKVEIARLGMQLRFSEDGGDSPDISNASKALPGLLERYSNPPSLTIPLYILSPGLGWWRGMSSSSCGFISFIGQHTKPWLPGRHQTLLILSHTYLTPFPSPSSARLRLHDLGLPKQPRRLRHLARACSRLYHHRPRQNAVQLRLHEETMSPASKPRRRLSDSARCPGYRSMGEVEGRHGCAVWRNP
jgi:hypothetical protein